MKLINIFIYSLIFCFLSDILWRKEEGPADTQLTIKPFRVLVMIGDQWSDPQSYNIDTRRVKGDDFIDVVTMLKIWGIPFDILRLDEQRLQINRFLDGEAKPNYGAWSGWPILINFRDIQLIIKL